MTFPEAPVLPGPWRLREGVVRAIFPLKDLRINGVAHIKLTSRDSDDEAWHYNYAWTADLADGESRPIGCLPDLLDTIYKAYPKASISAPVLKRIDYEENGWHYDIGIATKDTYLQEESITNEDRQNDQNFMLTIPVGSPKDFQGPTVCVPWTGAFRGHPVQAPKGDQWSRGYATIFAPKTCFHRADRYSGKTRGLYYQGVTIK